MASSKAGLHQKDGTLMIYDQLATAKGVVAGAAENNLGGLEFNELNFPLALNVGGTGQTTAALAIDALITGCGTDNQLQSTNQFAMEDGTGKRITWGNIMGNGKMKVLSYVGSGSSGKTVTLTGINRLHYAILSRVDAVTRNPNIVSANGATGTVTRRNTTAGTTASDISMGTQGAGSSQIMTLNNTSNDDNENGVTFVLMYCGTPT